MTRHPTQIKRLPDAISVQWNDGHQSEYSHRLLRQKCPCARCQSEKSDKNPLRLLPTDPLSKNLTLVDIQRVGRYAIRLIWADGHKTGIYTFEFLHTLQPDSIETVPGWQTTLTTGFFSHHFFMDSLPLVSSGTLIAHLFFRWKHLKIADSVPKNNDFWFII